MFTDVVLGHPVNVRLLTVGHLSIDENGSWKIYALLEVGGTNISTRLHGHTAYVGQSFWGTMDGNKNLVRPDPHGAIAAPAGRVPAGRFVQ